MSEDRSQQKPESRHLDGVLSDLRSVLSGVPAPAAELPVETLLPVPPTPPARSVEEDPTPLPPIPRGIETANEWLQPEAAAEPAPSPIFSTNAFSDDVAAPAEPVAAPEEASPSFDLPIPGTLETREAPVAAEDPDLDLVTESRPEGLVQIACLFPDGDEKKGQSFVNRLKESAARMRKPITVQPVFLHSWSSGAINVDAWAKSAVLSGADTIFVIAPKASAPLFAALAAAAAVAGTEGRFVPAELLQSPSLYADVLVDLKRKANGPR